MDSFKPLSFQRNIEKVPETGRTRKRRFTTTKKNIVLRKKKKQLCGIFICPCQTSVTAWQHLEDSSPHFQMWDPSSREREEDLVHKLPCLAQSKGHPEGITQGADLWFACLGIYPGWKSIKYCLKTCYGFFFFQCAATWDKIFQLKDTRDCSKPGGKARETFVVGVCLFFFFFLSAFSNNWEYWKI